MHEVTRACNPRVVFVPSRCACAGENGNYTKKGTDEAGGREYDYYGDGFEDWTRNHSDYSYEDSLGGEESEDEDDPFSDMNHDRLETVWEGEDGEVETYRMSQDMYKAKKKGEDSSDAHNHGPK